MMHATYSIYDWPRIDTDLKYMSKGRCIPSLKLYKDSEVHRTSYWSFHFEYLANQPTWKKEEEIFFTEHDSDGRTWNGGKPSRYFSWVQIGTRRLGFSGWNGALNDQCRTWSLKVASGLRLGWNQPWISLGMAKVDTIRSKLFAVTVCFHITVFALCHVLS